MNKIIPSSLAAILLALSASSALADAADRNYPDNPILAEHYFYAHQASAASLPQLHTQASKSARKADAGRPHFVSLPGAR
ncbi:hypothetical protein [Labrys monachus]|uniref:Uncharacterized protein n=1 Tax=Labrys monachus TaxID=217067 RepID=A0ABU0FDM9_9HYPH|nr:hypothetical protein [Labrys monachus]MDQ0392711.1 hypothetical protein [Labrys monachus]